MAISLQKGQKSLSKEAGGDLTQVKLGLGWDVAQGPQDKKVGFWENYLVAAAVVILLT